MTIVAFLIFPTATNNFNIESLRGQSISKMLRETVQNIQSDIGKRIYEMCLQYVQTAVLSVFLMFVSLSLSEVGFQHLIKFSVRAI